jgi:PAS domain S-box-containing protein
MNEAEATRARLLEELEKARNRIRELEDKKKDRQGRTAKEEEEMRRTREARLEALFEGNPPATFVWKHWGNDFILVQLNKAARKNFMNRPAALVGTKASDFYAHRPEIQDDLKRCLDEKTTVAKEIVSEHFFPRKDARITYALVPPDFVVVYMEDITERKRAEDGLRQSEERFRDLFQNMSSGVAVYEAVDDGRDFVFKDFNTAGERIEQISREHVIGRVLTEVFPGVEAFGLLDVFRRVWKTGTAEHHPISQYKDGRVSGWRENWVYKLRSGEVVSVYDDVTIRMQAEEQLKNSEAHLRSLIDAAGDAIFIININNNHLVDCNQQACSAYGYSRDELLRLSTADIEVSLTPAEISAVLGGFRAGTITEAERRHRRKDGSVFPVDIHFTVFDPAEPNLVVAVARDITERKLKEEKIQEQLQELRRWHEATLDRETRVLELKREVNQLLAETGRPPRYKSVASDDSQPPDVPTQSADLSAGSDVSSTRKG